MDASVLKIAVAAFVHDLGQLYAGSAGTEMNLSGPGRTVKEASVEAAGGPPSEWATVSLLERLHQTGLLPEKLFQTDWGGEESLQVLAGGACCPETPLQWIISVADALSKGWDKTQLMANRAHCRKGNDDSRTRLETVFSHLMQENLKPAQQMVRSYSLREVSPVSIFPLPRNEAEPADAGQAAAEYANLLARLEEGLKGLLHGKENLSLWFEHFESLVMLLTSLVPGAGYAPTDVPLYDHLRTTSAVASALFLYHGGTQSLTVEAVQDFDTRKFLLISGDFYGIQNFIFSDRGDVRKSRSKILRGRSFAVSLFTELAADLLCRSIGLPSICVLLNAAGRFTLLAPNLETTAAAVKEVEATVNGWLKKIAYGENSLGLDTVAAAPRDFAAGKFVELWEMLAQRMERKKFRKWAIDEVGGAVEDYLSGFQSTLHPLCPFCGKRPSSVIVEREDRELVGEAESACTICRDHIFLGTRLARRARLAITKAGANLSGQEDKLREPIFDHYQVAFVKGGLNHLARQGDLLKYWDVAGPAEDGGIAKDITAKFINGYVPVFKKPDLDEPRFLAGRRNPKRKEELLDPKNINAPKTFEHLSCMALQVDERDDPPSLRGTEALGVLKADVDHLGLLMACGLAEAQQVPSRLMALSRQMNWYFALYLPHLLKTRSEFQNVYTVFAGGDDLFLIGPWPAIIELVKVLQESFAEYVGHNPQIHFSAGITLHKPHTPLDKLAHQAEDSLAKAKDADRNHITLFGETVDWPCFAQLQEIKSTLHEWRQKGMVNNAMLYRLNDLSDLARQEEIVLQQQSIPLQHMECLKWHALFHYSAQRNIGKDQEPQAREQMLVDFEHAGKWLADYRGKLKIALWDVIYQCRKGA